MKQSKPFFKLLVVSFLVATILLSACTASYIYTPKLSTDGDKLWLIENGETDGKYPIVLECCDACGRNGQPRCFEATFN